VVHVEGRGTAEEDHVGAPQTASRPTSFQPLRGRSDPTRGAPSTSSTWLTPAFSALDQPDVDVERDGREAALGVRDPRAAARRTRGHDRNPRFSRAATSAASFPSTICQRYRRSSRAVSVRRRGRVPCIAPWRLRAAAHRPGDQRHWELVSAHTPSGASRRSGTDVSEPPTSQSSSSSCRPRAHFLGPLLGGPIDRLGPRTHRRHRQLARRRPTRLVLS